MVIDVAIGHFVPSTADLVNKFQTGTTNIPIAIRRNACDDARQQNEWNCEMSFAANGHCAGCHQEEHRWERKA
ncbi:hypothetical protein [Granulicella aggregans]|uniref:hypothetical protein n=1 Tax=Granulicella aggregans TaxID=474949 RepID=UPI0021E04DB9|nr:hypothetical protein [Granulicella aggregans]